MDMNLKIMIPDEVIYDAPVSKIVAEGPQGFFCLLPRHVDCFSTLVPGIVSVVPLVADRKVADELFVAVDQGVLIKRGGAVSISCRRAVVSSDLETVTEVVRQQFMIVDERERSVRSAAARLESAFVRKFMEFETT